MLWKCFCFADLLKMYWNIIPAFLIVNIALALPPALNVPINWFWLGNVYRRRVAECEQKMHYLRDRRLTGSPYKLAGLENIPDEPTETEGEDGGKKKKKKKCKKTVVTTY